MVALHYHLDARGAPRHARDHYHLGVTVRNFVNAGND
jgi:hypothetical protein